MTVKQLIETLSRLPADKQDWMVRYIDPACDCTLDLVTEVTRVSEQDREGYLFEHGEKHYILLG